MNKRIRLGVLTPSSNTALEPMTTEMVAGLSNVSAHFSRFTVTEISLGDRALGQFQVGKILDAAKLLADAHVDVIAWSGTSSGWLGFGTDESLCRQITEATGIPSTTSVLALNEILEKTGVRRLGLATPYLDDVQERIVANYRDIGITCVAERHLGLHVNFEFADVDELTICNLVRGIARAQPEAITTFCTNLHAAHLVELLEAEIGIPVYDTIATVVWKALRMTGVDTRGLRDWGRLFREVI
ncbi:maleate cis-trans isomerase family protein [Caballeronia ptereochthonis]|uniref:Asp/Glu/hydantoin racemase n=1 Tax=Caballeronia ptereochthonis TaxID=1777144 RepID=A0A157ZWB3_9BURK|nr:aspartate/glutamate racemase family protein [Caballeronia ptereochthonis]SAK49834.1 Asp/Glu/hydantoin racemase [Caballeronia ptereochthonis]